MAISLHSTGLHSLTRDPSPPPSMATISTKLFAGLRPQSAGAFGGGLPLNGSADFHSKVHRSLSLRLSNKRATRGRVLMMPIGTPRVPFRTPGEGTWQWVDLWNALYRERVIFIGQHIDEEYSNQVLATMLYLDSMDSSKKLYIYINGPGGDLTPSLAIYDTMQSLKSAVATQCVGYAYNLAGFLLAAGEKGSRTAMPLARIALQSPAGAARGQADDIRNEANELLRIRDYLFGELAKKTGQPVDKDIRTKQVIGGGREADGLYYLDVSPAKSLLSATTDSWHRRLGHHPLSIMRSLYPDLSFSTFSCVMYYGFTRTSVE